MAHFYEDMKDRSPTWEEVGGFNVHLLSAIRSAVRDVKSETAPREAVHVMVSEWVKRLPSFGFPDDEIG